MGEGHHTSPSTQPARSARPLTSTNEDLKAYNHMLTRMRVVVAEELQRAGTHDATKLDPSGFTHIEQQLREEFGGVDGFNSAVLFNTYYLVLAYIGGF